MSRTKVVLNCVADRYASRGERIIEFIDVETNAGGLIAFTRREHGLDIDVYRTDRCVIKNGLRAQTRAQDHAQQLLALLEQCLPELEALHKQEVQALTDVFDREIGLNSDAEEVACLEQLIANVKATITKVGGDPR